VLVPQPDGSLKELPDPRANQFSTDMLLTNGKAQITNNGPVIGNSKLKIGTPVELEGFNYNFNATVMTYEFQNDLTRGQEEHYDHHNVRSTNP